MVSDKKSLDEILDSFIKLVKGETKQEETSIPWIERNKSNLFCEGQQYHGIVESVYDENSAVVVVAQSNAGTPLQIHEVWNEHQVFVRVLLTVDRLCPSENFPAYSLETSISEAVKEGDVVAVKLNLLQNKSNSVFHYFAETGFKLCVNKKYMLEDIRDPLRGIVENINLVCSNQIGIIKFKTYGGLLAKALFSVENLHIKGKQCQKGNLLKSLIAENKEVFLNVKNLEPNEVKKEWEKEINRSEVAFLAKTVWLKNEPRPSEVCCNDVRDGNAKADTRKWKRITNRRNEIFHQRTAHKEKREGVNMKDEACGQSTSSAENDKIKSGEQSKDCNGNSRTSEKSNRKKNCFGTLVSVDEKWGLVKTVDNLLHSFKSDVVFLYGINIEGFPLQKIIFPDQTVKMVFREEVLISLEYGKPLNPQQIKKAISVYCEKHSICDELKHMLESLINKQKKP